VRWRTAKRIDGPDLEGMTRATISVVRDSSASCPFCRFEDPSVTVYSDQYVQAFISLQPINGWHVLIVPREHVERFSDIPVPVLVSVTMAAQAVSRAIEKAANPAGITIITEDDFADVGYNLIPHWKLHVIARYVDDAVKLEWGRNRESGPATRSGAASILRGEVARQR
jgi:histidine triad (HIT) family protein